MICATQSFALSRAARRIVLAGLFSCVLASAQSHIHRFFLQDRDAIKDLPVHSDLDVRQDASGNQAICDPFDTTLATHIVGTIRVPTVVGQGLTGVDIDGNGALLNPSAAVQNGIVSRRAKLTVSVSAGGIPHCFPVTRREVHYNVSLNGVPVGTVSGFSGPSQTVTITTLDNIDISLVRFGTRNIGGNPTPGLNQVTITADQGDVFDVWREAKTPFGEFPLGYATANLDFTAMAPIVLVHGWRAGPWWWGPNPSQPLSVSNPCGPRTDGQQFDGGFNFVQALQAADAPFTCAFNAKNMEATVSQGSLALQQKLQEIEAEFGTNHFHLVGHSKGGLFIRDALPHLAHDLNISMGVYSATTISTPHHGSVLANLLVQAHEKPWLIAINPGLVRGLLAESGPGAEDLQTSKAEAISQRLGDPPEFYVINDVDGYPGSLGIKDTARYFSIGADADCSASGKIQSSCSPNGKIDAASQLGDEGYPSPPWNWYQGSSIAVLKTGVANQRYQYLGKNTPVVVTPVPVQGRFGLQVGSLPPTPSFQLNDLAVAKESAKYLGSLDTATGQFRGFQPLTNGSNDYFQPYDHTTLGQPAVASRVLDAIRSAQPMDQ